jgi:hypothetical protein
MDYSSLVITVYFSSGLNVAAKSLISQPHLSIYKKFRDLFLYCNPFQSNNQNEVNQFKGRERIILMGHPKNKQVEERGRNKLRYK